MATSAWLLLGAGVWLAVLVTTCALLTAAKRADAGVQASACKIDFTGFTGVVRQVEELSALLGPRADAILVAVRESGPVAPVIAIATSGTADTLLGSMLPPDDHLSARAALTGRSETRLHAAALPLHRDDRTVGGVELVLAPEHGPVTAEDLGHLEHAAEAISVALSRAAPPHTPRYTLFQDDRVIGWLEWRAEPLGWFLEQPTRPARHLPVAMGIDALADPSPADAVATLSTPLALDAADRALRRAPAPAPSRPPEPDAYGLRITVAGLAPATVALCCPSMRVTGAGAATVITGVFDGATLQATTRRLSLLGAHVLAIFRDRGP